MASPAGMTARVTLAAVLCATATCTPPAPEPPTVATGPDTYQDLTTLFAEWREFEAPEFVAGVPDYSADAMAAQYAELPRWRARLDAIDPEGWPVAQQIDWHLVRAEMNGLDFDHRVRRPWARRRTGYRRWRIGWTPRCARRTALSPRPPLTKSVTSSARRTTAIRFVLRAHLHHWIELAAMAEAPHPSDVRRTPLLYNVWDARSEGPPGWRR